MVVAERVSVGSGSPTRLVKGDRNGVRIAVRNRGSVSIYLGGSDVTSNDGFQIDAGESAGFFMETNDSLYAITGSSTATVHVLQSKR